MKEDSGETLLRQLGEIARDEAAAARQYERTPAPPDTEKIVAAVEQSKRSGFRHDRWVARMRKLLRAWFAVPLVFSLGTTAWLLMRFSDPHPLPFPDYTLSITGGDSEMRDARDPALENTPAPRSFLRAGATASVVLRPATRTELTPEVQVWLEAAGKSTLLATSSEVDPSGCVRLQIPVPNSAGNIVVALGAVDLLPRSAEALARAEHNPSFRSWRLPVQPGL